MLNLEDRVIPNSSEIAAKIMDGEAILINLSTGMYYSMNNTGSAAWALFEQGHTIGEIANAMQQQYVVAADAVEQDIIRLADELVKQDILMLSEEKTSPPMASNGAEKLPYEAPLLTTYTDMQDLLALDPPMPGIEDVPWKNPE